MPKLRTAGGIPRSVLFSVFALVWLTVTPAPAQETPAMAAAARLRPLLEAVPAGREADYGFATRDELAQAYLGAPYEMVSILPRDLETASGGTAGILVSLETYRFPVLVQGKMRALLTVARVGDEWRAVNIGAAGLAASVGRIEESLPDPGEGGKRLFLRLFQLKIDLVGYANADQEAEDGTFVPLPSALAAIGAGPDTVILYTFPEAVKILRAKFAGLPDALKGDIKPKGVGKGVIR